MGIGDSALIAINFLKFSENEFNRFVDPKAIGGAKQKIYWENER